MDGHHGLLRLPDGAASEPAEHGLPSVPRRSRRGRLDDAARPRRDAGLPARRARARRGRAGPRAVPAGRRLGARAERRRPPDHDGRRGRVPRRRAACGQRRGDDRRRDAAARATKASRRWPPATLRSAATSCSTSAASWPPACATRASRRRGGRADGRVTFPNYTQIPRASRSPSGRAMRAGSIVGALVVAGLLVAVPDTGLFVMWKVVIPTLPLLFLVAPGLWRNLCPLAASNQTPRALKLTRALTAPKWLKEYGYVIAFSLFGVFVVLRRLGLDDSGPLSALLLLGAMTAAFAGGMVLKGKSGWCSTICPLLPVQRIYGQTPLALVANAALPAVRRLREELLRLQPARGLPGRPARRRQLLERLPALLRRRVPGPCRSASSSCRTGRRSRSSAGWRSSSRPASRASRCWARS